MTNLEKIQAMTEKELARFLMAAHDCEVHIPFCQNKGDCMDDLENGISPVRCLVCMMEWLEQPISKQFWEG